MKLKVTCEPRPFKISNHGNGYMVAVAAQTPFSATKFQVNDLSNPLERN
jgi:hypothetical protein